MQHWDNISCFLRNSDSSAAIFTNILDTFLVSVQIPLQEERADVSHQSAAKFKRNSAKFKDGSTKLN